MRLFSILLLVFVVFSCKNESKPIALSADDIISKAIEVSGGDAFGNAEIEFDFRDKYYVARRSHANFSLTRIAKTASDSTVDILNNQGFERLVNNNVIALNDSLKSVYSASVNSVHYFSILPYGLNDKAVNKSLIGEEQIKGKNYYKIKVAFSPDGGGEDYDDIFVYWINKETDKPDYFAYSYSEIDGIGMRFREAYNERYINGLRFVDYNNFKHEDTSVALSDLGKVFENNKLMLLSKIELENIGVELINL